MRNMSFSLTTAQFLDGTKTVTRRKGWLFLKPGDRVMAVKKAMGLKPGEKIERLGEFEVLGIRSEPLNQINVADCAREGFPNLSPAQFVQMFVGHMGGTNLQLVQRIEFRRI